jgi:hypothetical protein
MVLSALALGSFVFEAGCATSDDGDESQSLSEETRDVIKGMLEDVWPLVMEPQLDSTSDAASTLSGAVEAWLTAEEADADTEAAQSAAQNAWS